nr:hypothetical protein [Tanacetum cinerariifolium]
VSSLRVRSKEQCDDLINKVNLKSAEVSDLNASLQEKVLVDVAPLVSKLRKNRTAHTDYIRHTKEEAATLREIIESERLLSPLNTSLVYASQAQAKDTVILKLKEKLNSLNGDVKERKEKVLVITALKEQLKGEAVLTKAVFLNPIDPALLKVDAAPLVPKLHKNRTAHTDYIRHTQEEAATLREIVESERLLSPLNTSLVYACKYTRRIQELLMILQQTCPCLTEIGTKLVDVKPKNKIKQIRHTTQVTKSESITVTTTPSTNLESNKLVLSSTGVNLASSASGSLSQDNTKNNRIWRTQKKAKKNKVEDHLRTVKSSLNKESSTYSKVNSSVVNSVSNMNSDLKCVSCNGCLLSDNHDACTVVYINSVNTSKTSKSVKIPVKWKVWKTTGKVFKTVGHIWKPTGRTFTLVGHACPLTRIATPTIVPPKEPILIVNSTDKPVVTLVYSRKPKTKKVSNKIEPNNSWRSSSSNVPSSLFSCRLSKSSSGNVCPLIRIATPTIVPPREPIPIVNSTDKPVVTLVVQIVLWYLDSDCSKHMTGDRS